MTIRFVRQQFPPAIIRHAVWLYLRFTLSYRDVEDLLAERGLDVSYETVRRWVLKFGPLFAPPSTPARDKLRICRGFQHSALVDLVARRTKGKHGADHLFPECPVPKRSTSQRERSFRASNEFTEYRRSVGVEEVVPGRGARWSTSIRSGATSSPRPSRWTRWSTSSLLWWAMSAPG